MTLKLCPHCNQRYSVAIHTGDYIHDCNSGNVNLDQEDALIIGNATEFGNNVTPKMPSEIHIQGISNKFWGTTAMVEGERFGGVTVRGNKAQTHRQRKHYEYILED